MNRLLALTILFAAAAPVFAHKDVKPDDKTKLDPKDPVKLVKDYMKRAEQGLSNGQTNSGTVVAQEEAMILLDKLIKAAEQKQKQQNKQKQNQNKEQKKKPDNQQKKKQEQQKKEQKKQEQKKQKEKDKQEKKPSQSDKPSEKVKRGDSETQTAEEIEAKGEEWGSLPPQLRRELIEGMRENLPEKYKELLKLYYKKLSEIE
jgi:outer membrane biosynthesis protein TonB